MYSEEHTPQEWAKAQLALGETYLHRESGLPADNLARAVAAPEAALRVYDPQSTLSDWTDTQSLLGLAYFKWARTGRMSSINPAIDAFQAALQIVTREADSERWATLQTNLGLAHLMQVFAGYTQHAEAARSCFQAALGVLDRRVSPEEWATAQTSLAAALIHITNEPMQHVETALDHAQQALEVFTLEDFPDGWGSVQKVLAVCRRTGSRDPGCPYIVVSSGPLTRYLASSTVGGAFSDKLLGDIYFVRPIGDRSSNLERWQEAWQALDVALQAGSNLYRATFSESGRRIELDENARVAADAAYCLARLGRVREALEVLESARTRSLVQAMALNEAALALADEATRRRIREARDALQELDAESRLPPGTPGRRTEAEVEAALQQAYADLDAAFARIQSQLLDLTLSDFSLEEFICQLDSDTALAMPVVSSIGTAIFVLTGGTVAPEPAHVVWSSELTRESLRNLLVERDAEGKAVAGYLLAYVNDDPTAWAAAIEDIGRALWDQLMGPLHQCLQARGLRRVILIPQGMLHLLPLHAAWYETPTRDRRFFLDEYQTGYAPSGQVLARAWVHKTGNTEEAASPSGLLVNNPTGDLLFAQQEVANIAPLFVGHAVVLGGSSDRGQAIITPDAVLAAIPEADVFHFAGHGAFDWEDPLDSALLCFGGITGYDQDDRRSKAWVRVGCPAHTRQLKQGAPVE